MAATASGSAKLSYKVTNWRQYNESLVRRGDITFWFDEGLLDAWEHDNQAWKVGRPFTYSDMAIQTLLSMRELFRLTYRQTEGFGRAMAKLMQADVAIPDYTSLQKRAAKLGVSISFTQATGPIDIVVDSTGLKVYGEGEWKVRQHGKDQRRTWRKLHLAVNPATHEIVAQVLTDSSAADADQAKPLLAQIETEVQAFYGDGAYDQWKVYDAVKQRGAWSIIPPRKNAKIKQHGNSAADPLERDECIRQIRNSSRKAWKESIGYHRRSLAETAMSRLKRSFGERLKNRTKPNQIVEAALRAKLLNWFVLLGMPLFAWS